MSGGAERDGSSPDGAPGAGAAHDRAVPVRPGEGFDRERLAAWIAANVPQLSGAVAVRQFPAGFSNLTYLLRVGDDEVVLRRPPAGSTVATAHDMGREHRILAALHPAIGRVPRPIAYCRDREVIGAPFFLMERVRGMILRSELPPGVELAPATAARLGEAFAGQLAELHALDVGAIGLGDLGRPEGYVRRQVEGWSERWRAASGDDAVPELDEVAAWLAEEMPGEGGEAALVHNDFKYDNLVLDPEEPTEIRAVLDWEMATVGHPLLDLGTTLGYWVEAGDPEPIRRFRFAPTDVPGSPTRRELVAAYAAARGREVGHAGWAWVFGLFKIAVIAQQIWVRYRRGLTTDPRFAALPAAVRALAGQAGRAAGVLDEGRGGR